MVEIMEMLLCNVNKPKENNSNAYSKPLFVDYSNFPCKITYFVAKQPQNCTNHGY